MGNDKVNTECRWDQKASQQAELEKGNAVIFHKNRRELNATYYSMSSKDDLGLVQQGGELTQEKRHGLLIGCVGRPNFKCRSRENAKP